MDNKFLDTPFPPDLADLSPQLGAMLAAAARAGGFAVFELDGARMKTKPELMAYAARVLGFPGDFGGNWDALIDYLGDLANIHKNEKLLVLVGNSAEMSKADPKLYADLRESAGLACRNAREWSGNKVILKFAFITAAV